MTYVSVNVQSYTTIKDDMTASATHCIVCSLTNNTIRRTVLMTIGNLYTVDVNVNLHYLSHTLDFTMF